MNTMFLRHIFMAGLATACGIAVSAGTFAFLLVIGVIPRMIKRCNFGERILMVENTVILGVLTGAVFSVVEWKAQLPYPWLAHVILGAYGTAAGIFVGCIAVAAHRAGIGDFNRNIREFPMEFLQIRQKKIAADRVAGTDMQLS